MSVTDDRTGSTPAAAPNDAFGSSVQPGDESPAETAGVWEDFIDLFFAPRSVFERRRGWSAWPVLLVLSALLVLLFMAWQEILGPVMQLEVQRATAEAMSHNPELDAAQLEQMQSIGRLFGVIGMAVAFPLGILITAVVGWGLVGLFGGGAAFATVMGVVVYSQLVRVVQYVAGLLQALVMDVGSMDSVHDVSLSLARFLDQPGTSATLVDLAARVDVFTLWATALIAIGLSVATRLSRGSAWAVALIVWALAAMPTLLGGLIGG